MDPNLGNAAGSLDRVDWHKVLMTLMLSYRVSCQKNWTVLPESIGLLGAEVEQILENLELYLKNENKQNIKSEIPCQNYDSTADKNSIQKLFTLLGWGHRDIAENP